MRFLLAVRALAAVVLLPGVVAVYVPLRIARSAHRLVAPAASVTSVVAALVVLVGATVLLRCVWDFFAGGRGTLAPVDPPEHLVVRGLYRFTRNPMYNGVLAMLLGEAGLFRSAELVTYAALVFLAFHLMVVLYEERTLESRFGEAYRAYRRAVPRWGFTTRRYSEESRRKD